MLPCLTLIDESAFVFNADDYMKIRCDHRIVGKLIGCAVKWPRNINLAGLPAIYSSYQTQLLIDKGFARIVTKNLDESPDKESMEKYTELQLTQQTQFTDHYRDKKLAETEKIIDKIIEGKRKKASNCGNDPSLVTKETVLDELKQKWAFNSENILVQVPTEDPFACESTQIFSLPGLNQLKYRVFCDLWEKQKWITSGDTFGGDFLIYPGDPLYFHASHIVHVLDDNTSKRIPTNLLIARGRISVTVNKFCVFAYPNRENNRIKYQTFEWLGK